MVKGDSTPLNEAPIRWWGGRRGWVDDWDNIAQQSHGTYDPYVPHFSGRGEPDGAIGMGIAQTGYGNPSTFREPFGRGGRGPGAFLDEEIHASFDGVGGMDTRFAEPLVPGLVHAPVGTNTRYTVDGIPVSRAVPMPVAPGGARSRIQNDSPGCGEVEIGPPVDGAIVMQKMPDNSPHRLSCHVHSHRNAGGVTPDGAVSGCFCYLGDFSS